MINRKILILFLPFIQIFGQEKNIKEIYLEGLITDKKQEISGMDWYNDRLFLLPENLGGFLFTISKVEIFLICTPYLLLLMGDPAIKDI